ncbi:HNH endonuclease family protein [Francisella philomiragia]|uniref:hypothetical protein n=1 Tax=Francisella philomiragia TaxID=28110 RepID=UPI001906CC73|nr:hypothetical protein [Francisella philomiragia]MBK2105475.1 HNH endonuclease [Francisella philomiragia]
MIKLSRPPKPEFLTDEKVNELVEKFKNTKSTVWNHDEIKTPLLESSNHKCAYCECKLGEESKYMEVEHFEDKKHNPDKVVEWDNLLPSCKRCNGKKKCHDVIDEPIINPYNINPKNHLGVKLYRLKGISSIGNNTIEALLLNDQTRIVARRFEIGNAILERIDDARLRYCEYVNNKTTQKRNRLTSLVEAILIECQPQSHYSATSATVLINDIDFIELIINMRKESIFDDELEELFNNAQRIALKEM